MTENDLIVIAPWAIFGLGLATVLLRLRRSRGSSRRAAPPGHQARPPESAAPGPEPRPDQEPHPGQAGRCTGREAR
jgi:hypothetical protein